MRTTVDLPPAVHRRAQEMARAQGRSLSATIAELTARGLAQVEQPLIVGTDEVTGFPVLRLGRRVTSEDVVTVLDDD